MLTKDEFEAAWMQMLSMYALEKNSYLYQKYETNDKWAKLKDAKYVCFEEEFISIPNI
jgi:hypothetical protein